jgi:hypothetical protein
MRLLNESRAPVYVFDDERRLVFANRSCAQWVGVPLDDLLGRIGSYTSAGCPESTAVDHLCPPPDMFAGRRRSGMVYTSGGGALRRRRADFVPLGDPNGGANSVAVLVVCSVTDERDGDFSQVDESRPFANPGDVAAMLHERIAEFQAQQQSRFRLEYLVGDSAAMQLARSQVKAAIVSRAGVTVVGPPGSGRQRLARTIHYNRDQNPGGPNQYPPAENLVVLDGSLITTDVLNSAVSTLTAHSRDSSTAILLLHLDCVPLEHQTEIVRLFSRRSPAARLLATSAQEPSELVEQGRLHQQLAAVVSTIVVRLPPITKRREDIPVLAQCFLEEHNAQGSKQLRSIAPEAIDELIAYSWPGDVAELRSLVNEACARAEGFEITPADLPRRLSIATSALRRPPRGREAIVLEDFLASVERELIERALGEAKGNKARAARLLGLTRPRFYRRMVQLGLEPADNKTSVADAVTAPVKRDHKVGKARKPPARDSAVNQLAESGAPAVELPEFIEDIPFEEQQE